MSPNKLGVFANLALAASAMLIPPTITAEDLGDNNALGMFAIDPFKRSVAVECPGCASATLEGESLKWKADAGNTFLLNFEVGPGEQSLELDGYQLYPPSFSYSTRPFHVIQVDPSSEEGLRLRVTGYNFRYNGAQTMSEAGTELLPMILQITSVEGTTVNPPALNINILKDSEGRLMIASFQAAQPTESTPTDQDKECKEWPLFCKWKSILADRIEKMKKMGKPGCHKQPHSNGRPSNPMEHETTVGKPPHRFRPGQHHPHHRPHHIDHEGHRHHNVHMFIRRAFFTIFVPILIGIFAGTLTYLVGMAVGYLIAITIAKFRGQTYQRIVLQDDVEQPEEDGEKEEYAELPAYDSPPVYEEAAEKEVVEEAK
ncbi:hypothetical protein EJ02DRAFT_396061 [Clathrospora elynae]|uniref:DUF7728 domain-containing protein n=1 Tax=Clathrospora elynae TaxID=706981 RepID=A0A6A5T203_9PLEO|nr:hypothetical protein EJ02DRAFT_396061 [Clathrospora elynae]